MNINLSRSNFPGFCQLFCTMLVSCIFLSGCAAASKVRDDPDKLVDDGKRNTVLLSYDIVLESAEKHSTVSNTKLRIQCAGTNKLTADPTCFDLTVPFVGKKTVSGYITNSFELEGVTAFQMKYGEYNFSRLGHNVVISKWVEPYCYEDKKGKRRCSTRNKSDSARHTGVIPASHRLFVYPGSGCYVGHLKVHMSNSEVTKFDLVSNFEDMDDELIAKLPLAIQDAIRIRVTQLCAS